MEAETSSEANQPAWCQSTSALTTEPKKSRTGDISWASRRPAIPNANQRATSKVHSGNCNDATSNTLY